MIFLDKFNIKIKNEELLLTALTHSSYANENNVESYERLEFLGDAVLQLASSEYFYQKNKKFKEGALSKTRASYVCANALYEYSNKIGLTPNIRTSSGTNLTVNIVADCFESVLAVIFLEHGYSVAKKYALSIIEPYVENEVVFIQDYKSYLQETAQTDKTSIEYVITKESGPANDKTYEVDVLVDGIVLGHGVGKRKQEAEQNAAGDAISKIAKG